MEELSLDCSCGTEDSWKLLPLLSLAQLPLNIVHVAAYVLVYMYTCSAIMCVYLTSLLSIVEI